MKLCEYGCGQEAKYPPRKGKLKWSCENTPNKCPEIKRKNIEKNKGRLPWNTGKEICEKVIIICPICKLKVLRSKSYIDKISLITCGNKECVSLLKKGIKRGLNKKKYSKHKIVNNYNVNILCDYGCNNIANYKLIFKNHYKYCCNDHPNKCICVKNKMIVKVKKKNIGHIVLDETKKTISRKIKQLYNKNDDYKFKMYNKSINQKNTLNYYKIKYPIFSKVEEIRYNPNKPGKKEIQVHCKNHLCPNSKEQGGWFTPTKIQLYERIRQLENPKGSDGCHFYCCNECKQECPLFRLRSDPNKENDLNYTNEEYQTFREEVLKREEYKCEYCDEPANIVHHSRPQKLEPFFSLDLDYGIACCENCHYKYGHKDECSTGKIANKICN